MIRELPTDIEPLLRDGEWFARLTRALLAEGEEDGDDLPVAERVRHPLASANSSEAVALAELRLELLESVLALAPPWRTAVVLRYLEGIRLSRISEITHASQAVVRRRVRRGLRWIRAALSSRSAHDDGIH